MAGKKENYIDFMGNYRIDCYGNPDVTGRFWLGEILPVTEEKEQIIALLDDLIPFVTWTYSYAQIFAYQYVIEYYGSGQINHGMYVPYNYWELKEMEHKLDTISEEQLRKESEYFNREQLLYKLIEQGVVLSQALEITRRIRMGKGLKDTHKELLLSKGMNDCEALNQIRFLPSIVNTFLMIFNVNKLITGGK